MSPAAEPKLKKSQELWQSLHIFNLYRLTVIGIIAVTFFITTTGETSLGIGAPRLFGITISIWLAVAFVSGFASRLRYPDFYWQAYALIFSDICFITVLMYASGDITSGLGALMMVTIAASGILLSGRISFAFAAFATLAIFTSQGYRLLLGEHAPTQVYVQSGLLGAGLFAVALLAYLLTRRLQASEALAERRKEELAGLEHINELIIQHMQTGVLLIGKDNRIKLMNKFARQLLRQSEDFTGKPLRMLSTELQHQLDLWRKNPLQDIQPFRVALESSEILPRIMSLGSDLTLDSILIFLDDTAHLSHRAQQAKLASLGRLTASIAHEIRNPLSAINHASQLLSESRDLPAEDERLTQIISQQTHRLDIIVENILSLSRKKEFKPEAVDIVQWMRSFHDNLLLEEGVVADSVRLDLPKEKIMVTFDTSHLNQIMCNLVNNGIRHARENESDTLLDISCATSEDNQQTYIDIIDHGSGISDDHRDKLFEPFFTTEATGTGLGLYISKELSQLNHAHLQFIDDQDRGAHFRISLLNAA